MCFSVLIEPKKALRKLPRVQHLYAQLTGRLQSEDDEVDLIVDYSSCICYLICTSLGTSGYSEPTET